MKHTFTVSIGKHGHHAETVISKETDDVFAEQGKFFAAGALAEHHRLADHGPTPEREEYHIRFAVDGGAPSEGGKHSSLTAKTMLPVKGGMDLGKKFISEAFAK